MAGVGFELKKLFKKKGSFFHLLKAYSVSAIVTEGPLLLNIILLFALRLMLNLFGASYAVQELYLVTTTYIMTFSLGSANTVLMFISRFISDCIYEKRRKDILPSFFTTIFWMLLILGPVFGIYIFSLDKPLLHKMLNLLQFLVMLIVWIQMAYLSAIKKYLLVLLGFIAATLGSISFSLIFLFAGMEALTAVFTASLIGYLILLILYTKEMIQYFPMGEVNLFLLFPHLDKYKDLLLTGFLITVGMYGHTIVFWFSEYSTKVMDYMAYCMKYDISNYFASLTILPFMVTFVVSMEVDFYEAYRKYFDTILNEGTYDDIKAERRNLTKTLFRELAHVFEMQFFIEIICITFLANLLSVLGFDLEMLVIYRYLCIGYCFYVLAKSVIIILMYFDSRIGALKVSAVFAVTSVAFSIATLFFGIESYGLGFVAALAVTALYGIITLKKYIEHLEFHVFCSQPLFADNEIGVFERLGGYWNEKLKKKGKQ